MIDGGHFVFAGTPKLFAKVINALFSWAGCRWRLGHFSRRRLRGRLRLWCWRWLSRDRWRWAGGLGLWRIGGGTVHAHWHDHERRIACAQSSWTDVVGNAQFYLLIAQVAGHPKDRLDILWVVRGQEFGVWLDVVNVVASLGIGSERAQASVWVLVYADRVGVAGLAFVAWQHLDDGAGLAHDAEPTASVDGVNRHLSVIWDDCFAVVIAFFDRPWLCIPLFVITDVVGTFTSAVFLLNPDKNPAIGGPQIGAVALDGRQGVPSCVSRNHRIDGGYHIGRGLWLLDRRHRRRSLGRWLGRHVVLALSCGELVSPFLEQGERPFLIQDDKCSIARHFDGDGANGFTHLCAQLFDLARQFCRLVSR